MKAKLPILLMVIALLLINTVYAQETEINTRKAQHLFMPFIGYQAMNGESVGFTYGTQYIDYIAQDTTDIVRSGTSERDKTIPELGITYRYMPVDLLYAEFTISAIHDKVNFEYPVNYEVESYNARSKVSVSRSNTIATTLAMIVNVPFESRSFKPSIRLVGGYAWRSIDVETNYASENASAIDPERMYVVRGGVDLSLWRENKFMIEGSIFYTSFIPTDDEVDPFGGLGWRICVFPVWSNKTR